MQKQPRAYRLLSVFGAISSTIDVILPDLAIVFQILPNAAGREELAGEFEPIRNFEIFLAF